MPLLGKFMFYTFAAIGGYLVLKNYVGFERVVGAGSNFYNSGARTLQGR